MDGQPAARVGDMTAHSSPLAGSPGSPDVLIGKRPAWRGIAAQSAAAPDTHTCPFHGTGVVTHGSQTVRINGLAACRMGDPIQEAASLNRIVAGESTVLIGG